MLFCQSIDLVITIDTFYWLLSKSPLSQSETLLNKSRLECAIHVFNIVSLCPPLFAVGGHSGIDPAPSTDLWSLLDLAKEWWLLWLARRGRNTFSPEVGVHLHRSSRSPRWARRLHKCSNIAIPTTQSPRLHTE